MSVQILRGNALDLPLADNSVDLICTSPPYFGLRSYQDGGEHYAGQIGSEPTPAEFIDALLTATREMVRVLKPSGSLWVNLGDKYVSRQSGYDQTDGGSWAKIHGENGDDRVNGEKVAHARDERTRSHYLTERTGIRAKSLIGIPWRYALRCIDDLGIILRAEVIWSKPNGLPEPVTDRVRRSHETWVHFTTQPRYFSAVDEVRETYAPSSLTPNKVGAAAMRGRAQMPGRMDETGYTPGWEPSPLGKLPGSVWTVPTQPLTVPANLGVDHFAAFPMEWPRRIIRGWSPAGVCTGCGEGLVPVTAKDGGRPVARAHRHLPGYSDPAGEGLRDMTYRIEGYSCSCPTTASAKRTARRTPTTTDPTAAVAEVLPRRTRGATAPTRPAVVLDPFGGTGTTALVAHALGRRGISVDMSADYCRLAQWRTTDPGQLAAAMQVEKPPPVMDGQGDLFTEVAG